MSYTWKWDLDQRGYEEVPLVDYTLGQHKKREYVEQYLSPSIKHSKCGWNHCVFCVLKNQYNTSEYVVLYPAESNHNGRYICVNGNSLGAIAEATWMNVFH